MKNCNTTATILQSSRWECKRIEKKAKGGGVQMAAMFSHLLADTTALRMDVSVFTRRRGVTSRRSLATDQEIQVQVDVTLLAATAWAEDDWTARVYLCQEDSLSEVKTITGQRVTHGQLLCLLEHQSEDRMEGCLNFKLTRDFVPCSKYNFHIEVAGRNIPMALRVKSPAFQIHQR